MHKKKKMKKKIEKDHHPSSTTNEVRDSGGVRMGEGDGAPSVLTRLGRQTEVCV